jgi:hypothetical protein
LFKGRVWVGLRILEKQPGNTGLLI